MALTNEEMESQIASLNETIKTLTANGDSAKAEITKRDEQIAALNKQLAESPAAEVETLKKKVSELEPVAKENTQLKQQIFLGTLASKYPLVDLVLISGKDNAELEANAARLQAHIEKVRPVVPAANAAGDPSNPNPKPWSALGTGSGDLDEARRKREDESKDKAVEDAKASGSASKVIDALFEKAGGAAKVLGVMGSKK